MKLPLYQVDAFTDKVFGGNPAAVCPLDKWLPDEILQKIALENNLSETAFFVKKGKGFHLRWFTPTAEVDLCGHATLATAYVIFEELGFDKKEIEFDSRSGILKVKKTKDGYTMDFPSWQWEQPTIEEAQIIENIIGQPPKDVLKNKDAWCAVLPSENTVQNFMPDLAAINTLENVLGLIITAEGQQSGRDFVSRFFAPQVGIDEDPVTGAIHCLLTPYWSGQLRKTKHSARQISARGGDLTCELKGDRVLISGQAVLFMQGTFNVGS